VLNGKGASLLDGYMEDLATDRIYRYMIAQRTLHQVRVPDAQGREVTHSPELVSELFDEELDRLLRETSKNGDPSSADSYRRAREQSEGMILGVLQEQGVSIR
jgi:malate synthase